MKKSKQKKRNLTRSEVEYEYLLDRELLLRSCTESFWMYCKTMEPTFYFEGRKHLYILCTALGKLFYKLLLKPDGTPYLNIIINMPPRMGKTRTLVLFACWMLGKDITNRIISTSYNDKEANDFSRYVRDRIGEKKVYVTDIVHSDVFPQCVLKAGHKGVEEWALEGQYFSFKSAGIKGSVTGKGGHLFIDDPIKDFKTAANDNALIEIWEWLKNTLFSRCEEGMFKIINHTRWRINDPAGMILNDPDLCKDYYIISMEMYNPDTDEMLCDTLCSKEQYDYLKKNIDDYIFDANFHQKPFDKKGRLYDRFLEWSDSPEGGLPERFDTILSYTDAADTGDDFLAKAIAGLYNKNLYILDFYYTQDHMPITEKEAAKLNQYHSVKADYVESQAGGKGFLRNVEKYCRETLGYLGCRYKWFHQSQNKQMRIRSEVSYATNNVFFPDNWAKRNPALYKALAGYQFQGKNEHDDAPDALTGLIEKARIEWKTERNFSYRNKPEEHQATATSMI